MSLHELYQLLLRRWPVMLAVAVLTGAAAATAFATAEDVFTLESSLIIESAGSPGDEGVSTPEALAQVLNSGETRQDVAEEGGTASYEVDADGDFVYVRATSEPDSSARRTVELVLTRLERDLPDVAEEYGNGREGVRADIVATPGIRGRTTEGEAIVEAAVLVIEPPGGQNPFVNSDYAGQVLLAAVQAQIAAGVLDLQDPDEVGFSFDYRLPAPILGIEITSDDRAETLRLYRDTIELLQVTMDRLQEDRGIGPLGRTSLVPVLAEATPERTPASPLRVVVAILALGMVLMVLAALAADAFVARRIPEDGDGPEGRSEPDEKSAPRRNTADALDAYLAREARSGSSSE